jgi:acetyl-CoA carboxylase biotin carboxyl carrier protein
MANLKEIQDFLTNLAKTDIVKIKIKDGDLELTAQFKPDVQVATTVAQPVVQQQVPVAQQATQQQTVEKSSEQKVETGNYLTIKAPMVGTFYRKPAPDKPAYVEVGQKIHKGDIVCIIEAMKLFNEIESDIDGEIVEILVDDATPVEFDQPIFRVKPL